MTEGREPTPEGPPPEVGRWVTAAFVLFPLVAWGLGARLGLPAADAVFLAGIVELLPVLAIAQVPLAAGARIERVPAYLASAATITTLGAAAAVLGARRLGVDGLGLGAPSPVALASWVGGLGAVVAAVVLALHGLRRRLGLREGPLLRELLPRTPREKRIFVLLSLAAGVGEEVAFRGYALPTLAPHLGGPWGAALFTSLVFGLLHAYQGAPGMVRTVLVGFLLAASLILSGSLWPAVVVHVLVDVVAGLYLGDRLTR